MFIPRGKDKKGSCELCVYFDMQVAVDTSGRKNIISKRRTWSDDSHRSLPIGFNAAFRKISRGFIIYYYYYCSGLNLSVCLGLGYFLLFFFPKWRRNDWNWRFYFEAGIWSWSHMMSPENIVNVIAEIE